MTEYIERVKLLDELGESASYHAESGREYQLLLRDRNIVREQPTANVIPIPEGATNGDMIKAMFPNLEVEIESTHITCWIDEHRWFAPDYNWWNTSYKKEVEE